MHICRIDIAVMGKTGVGKSALTVRYVLGDYGEYIDPTVEDYYRKLVEVDGVVENISIIDTPGYDNEWFMEYYNADCNRQITNFLLVYDISSEESFKMVDECYKHIIKDKQFYNVPLDFNVVLVAHKVDLRDIVDEDLAKMGLKKDDFRKLVYGYLNEDGDTLQRNDNLCIKFMPDEIKEICLLYIGENSMVQVSDKMGKELAESWEGSSNCIVEYMEASAKDNYNVTDVFETLVKLAQNARVQSMQ